MPPWHAESTDYKFQGSRRLTEKQIATIEEWVETGMTEGDPEKLPELPKYTSGWRLGEPDLVVKMKEPYPVPAEGRFLHWQTMVDGVYQHQQMIMLMMQQEWVLTFMNLILLLSFQHY